MMKNNANFTYKKSEKLFSSKSDFEEWCEWIDLGEKKKTLREFGDYQTPIELVNRVYDIVDEKKISFNSILEPTMGQGNFLTQALQRYENIKKIVGIETQKYYVNKFKESILSNNLLPAETEIDIRNENFFGFDLEALNLDDTLMIGNPPWVTNSELVSLGSSNLPIKINFKNHKGLDALTGKSNFDVGEYILGSLIDMQSKKSTLNSGHVVFLVKKIVAINLLKDAPRRKWNITSFDVYNIDSKKEFNVSVDACLIMIGLNENKTNGDLVANEYSIYEPKKLIKTFGWINDKFVSNVQSYKKTMKIDSVDPNSNFYIWRSGLKHDASKVMELDYDPKKNTITSSVGGLFHTNEPYVFPLIKSSHIRKIDMDFIPKKYVIVTQRNMKETTDEIENKSKNIWTYLQENSEKLDNRKSSIYKGKTRFAMFGIGDYSFSNYKVAISGMYKESKFALIKPYKGKPVMLDDTVYSISAKSETEAFILFGVLNSQLVQLFLKSIAFDGNKRPYTKDILQRINIELASKMLNTEQINEVISQYGYSYLISESEFKNFQTSIKFQQLKLSI